MNDLILYGIIVIAFFAFYVIKAFVEVAKENRQEKKRYRKNGQLVDADEVMDQDLNKIDMHNLPETATRTYEYKRDGEEYSMEKITCPTCGAPLPSMHHRCSYCGTKCRIKKNN